MKHDLSTALLIVACAGFMVGLLVIRTWGFAVGLLVTGVWADTGS